MCAALVLIALYAAGGLAAAQIIRAAPVVGGIAGDRIEAWVLGAYEPDTAAYPPYAGGTEVPPITATPIFTGPVVYDPACMRPHSWPAAGPITSGYRPPDRPNHTGIDISMVTGTPVRTTMCGTVIFAGWSDIGYGYMVIVVNGLWETRYAHLSAIHVGPGDNLEQFQLVGDSGNSGNSTGPHLHYEVRFDTEPRDPMPYLGG